MRILLTGADGFTGRFFSVLARDVGHDVWPLKANLLNKDALNLEVSLCRPDVVLHLAAISHVAHADTDEIYHVNFLGTRYLLNALNAVSSSLRHVILVSSASVYGNQSEGLISEDAYPVPVNDYGVSKLAMELLANMWRNTLPISVIRPFNYVGAGQSTSFVIPKIIAHFKSRSAHIDLGNLNVYREYNDVRWVARCYLELLGKAPLDGSLNIASGNLHSLYDVLLIMKELTGNSITVNVNSQFVRANEVSRLGGDPSRLHSLGLTSSPFSLRDTLAWMLACA